MRYKFFGFNPQKVIDVNNERKCQETFGVIEKSGAVSVDLVRFFKSDMGRMQIKSMEALRDYIRSRAQGQTDSKK